MGQFRVWAKICVGKEQNKYSNQVQLTGDFMRQKWRIYGLSNSTGGNGWRIVLWVATMFIVIMTFLTGFSIGLFLLPSTLLALLASAFSLGARRAALG